jgi:hypothetical protein
MAPRTAKASARTKRASGERKKPAARKKITQAKQMKKKQPVVAAARGRRSPTRIVSRPVPRTSTPIPDADLRTPAQTSSHGPFDQRSRRDPDKIPPGAKLINDQFAEEDEYTNKTGDPRIGTHGRRY